MKLSEYRGEDALELIADILDPVSLIFSDKDIEKIAKENSIGAAISLSLRKYKKEILLVLARIEGVAPEEYNPSIFEMVNTIKEITEEPVLKEFFTSQGQKILESASGSATENTEGTENG